MKLISSKNICLYVVLLCSMRFFQAAPILVTSTIKCGTHLLTQAVTLLSGKQKLVFFDQDYFIRRAKLPPLQDNQFLQNHVPYTRESVLFYKKNRLKVLYIYRDPRDQLVSRAYWILKNPKEHPEYARYATVEDLITCLIPDVEQVYNQFDGWMHETDVCTTKFEDLIGPKGKGNAKAQATAIRKIAAYLDIQLTQERLLNCINNIFGGKKETFREGQIGSWKKHFTQKHKELFKKYGSRLLKRLGYERNDAW